MKRSSLTNRLCSLARASAEVSDSWTFMILRELFLRNRRFDGIQAQTGMSPRSLTLRLNALVDADILIRTPYQTAPLRHEYRLTEKGLELWPVVVALRQWGDKWNGPWPDEVPPLSLTHKGHDHELHVHMVCTICGEPVTARSAQVHAGHHALLERQAMAERHDSTKKPRKPMGQRHTPATTTGDHP
jgi:DNA-binding HxlR family transcriptional regulator